jgi:hypothetical protein
MARVSRRRCCRAVRSSAGVAAAAVGGRGAAAGAGGGRVACAPADFGGISAGELFRDEGLDRAAAACEGVSGEVGAVASAVAVVSGALTGGGAAGGALRVGDSGAEAGTELFGEEGGAGGDASGVGGREALLWCAHELRSRSRGTEAMHSRCTRNSRTVTWTAADSSAGP